MNRREEVATALCNDPYLALAGAKIMDLVEQVREEGITLDLKVQLGRWLEMVGISYRPDEFIGLMT